MVQLLHGVIATGTLLVVNSTNDEFIIPTLNVPTLNVPGLNIPDLGVTALNVPTLNTDSANIETLKSPELITNNITEQYSINIIQLDSVESINSFDIVSDLEIPEMNVKTIDITSITDLTYWKKRLLAINEFKKLVKDQRNSEYSDHPYITEWQKIYSEYKNVEPIKYIQMPSGIKMISEIICSTSLEEYNTLKENLKMYKEKGYNAVLINVCVNDKPSNMINLALLVKSMNMLPFFTFGGTEKLQDEIYVNPEWIKSMIQALGPECARFYSLEKNCFTLVYT